MSLHKLGESQPHDSFNMPNMPNKPGYYGVVVLYIDHMPVLSTGDRAH
jgi:hypothetical protein